MWCGTTNDPFAQAPEEVAEILGEESYRRTKVLICAPSNSALDEIVLRIMKTGVYGPNGSAYSPTLVRVGVNVHHSAGLTSDCLFVCLFTRSIHNRSL